MNTPIPCFSVIIPTYNRQAFLKKSVDSVLAQTFPDFELIIIDDGSNDGTDKLISSYNDKRIIYKYQQNNGVASARNNGIKRSSGKFIAFLDSDDYWTKKKLKKQTEYIKNFSDIKIFHTEELWYRNNKFLNQKKEHKKPSGHVYLRALPLCCIGMSTTVVKKEIFDSVGMFDESLEACEDYDFWLRTTCKYEVKLIPEALTIKDGGRPDQLSSKVWGLDRFRIKALEKMLTHGDLSPEYYHATFEELEKKCGIFSQGSKKRGKIEEATYYSVLPEKYIKNNI